MGLTYFLYWKMRFVALGLGICQWKTATENGVLTKLELGNEIWKITGLGNGIYTRTSHDPFIYGNHTKADCISILRKLCASRMKGRCMLDKDPTNEKKLSKQAFNRFHLDGHL